MYSFIQSTGRSIISFMRFIIDLFVRIPEEISIISKHFFSKNKIFRNIFIKEIYHSGVMALPVVIFISTLISLVFIKLFPFDALGKNGDILYGNIYYILVLREIAPMIVLAIIAIRSTIYITIQISQMKIGLEVRNLEILGINPKVYLGSMRVFAGILIAPILGAYYIVFSLLSAAIFAQINFDIPFLSFISETFRRFSWKDVFVFIFKMSFCGYVIYSIAVYNGITAENKRNMIISRTVRAITQSLFAVILFSALLSSLLYG